MNEKTVAKLKQVYKEFYFRNSDRVVTPIRVSEREFGYVPFGGSMVRHLSFKEDGDLKAFLVREAPHSVYYSVSFYFEPSLSMAEKGWKGADVVFDIDCDDLQSPCKQKHDRWLCKACNFLGEGMRPEKCLNCGSEKIEELNWVCENCLSRAKDEALKLLDILMSDFGLQKKDIKTYFSGNMGYHITVENSIFEELDQMARNELADYVAGRGLLVETLGITRQSRYEELIDRLPTPNEPGWRGRIARYFVDYHPKEYSGKDEDVRIKMASIYEKAGYNSFKKLIEEVAKRNGSYIDSTVTTDVHRIFRLGGTLHGETGLMKTLCEDLVEFDPLTDAVALSDEPVEVWVKHSPNFKLKEQMFGPFMTERVRLPLMASVYLMARGLAEVI